ncbi:lytic transglycosylase domain-containing protein [Bordetella muralis]|uniref:lytic transglycosylase domain-containing protein n=1 Tax=Bordetella muralis TaxID=1649130 RepID=UPI0039EE565A
MKRKSWRNTARLFLASLILLVLPPTTWAQTGKVKAKTKTANKHRASAPPAMQIIENGIVVAEINLHGGELVLSYPASTVAQTTKAAKTTKTARRQPPSQAIHDPVQLYDPVIREAAWRYGMDPDLLHAVIKVESNYNPHAVSPKGATGLMQIMPATGVELGFANPRRDLLIPANNIDAGARYLAWLKDQFDGDLSLALAAYNAGIGAVTRNQALSNYPETSKYVRSVLDLYRQAELTALLRARY